MNNQKKVAFDPKVYNAWKSLAAAILNPDFDTNCGRQSTLSSKSEISCQPCQQV